MRILIIPSWYPTPSNPVNGIFVQQQAGALSKTHDLRVLYLDMLPRGERRKPRRYLNKRKDYIEEIVEVPNRPLIWQFTYLWYMLRAFINLRRKFMPDIIHCHVAVPAGWAVALLRRLFGVPVILTEHTSEFDSWRKRPGQRWMAAVAYGSADAVLPVSEGQRFQLQQNFRCRNRVLVVSNMVDTDRFTQTPFPPTAEGYHLLFVGLMETGQKGVPILLQAISQIKQSGHPLELSLHLDLVGGGKLLPEYQTLARQIALDDMVTFHGYQPPAVVAQMLRESHALVLPSHFESQGVVVIEALASGRPVVSTRCGGPEFMVNSTNGLIVEPGNATELAAAIVNLLTHLDRYDPASIASNAVSLYSYNAVVSTLSEIYDSVQNHSVRPHR